MNTNSNNNTNNNRIELNTKKTMLELRDEISKDGVKLTYVTYDGAKIGILGYLNEADKKKAEAALKKVSDEVSSPLELIAKLNELTAIDDSGITPDEEVEVNGYRCYIDYGAKTLYMAESCDKVVDLSDLSCDLPNEAIKALLVERGKNALVDDDCDDPDEF